MGTKNSNGGTYMSSLHLDPYEELANAVILQAVKDYRDALKTLSKNPRVCQVKCVSSFLHLFP